MFYTQVMKEFRKKYDCRDMDKDGSLPVFIFHIFEWKNNQWNKIDWEFYADTPLEAIDQANEEIVTVHGTFMAKCVNACNYYIGSDNDPHVILELKMLKLIQDGHYYQKFLLESEDFQHNLLTRREEMKKKKILC